VPEIYIPTSEEEPLRHRRRRLRPEVVGLPRGLIEYIVITAEGLMAQRQRLPPAKATPTNAPIVSVERNTGESAENTGTGDVDDV
jgi:hypothetical protein